VAIALGAAFVYWHRQGWCPAPPAPRVWRARNEANIVEKTTGPARSDSGSRPNCRR